MAIDSISSVNMYQTTAVQSINAVQMGGLSEETIKKLKELGIDPSTVKSESEAQALIAQAQTQKTQGNQQAGQVQGKTDAQMQEMQEKSKDLSDKIKDLADKLGITISQTDTPKVSIEKLEQAVNQVTAPNSANGVNSITSKNIDEKPEDLKRELQDIKTKYNDLESAKNATYAGQDMMAMLNKMALGL